MDIQLPHASHAGGISERMIGMARKILDAMLHELPTKQLTHEVLTTLMAEVVAIMNSRPLTPVSTDPDTIASQPLLGPMEKRIPPLVTSKTQDSQVKTGKSERLR